MSPKARKYLSEVGYGILGGLGWASVMSLGPRLHDEYARFAASVFGLVAVIIAIRGVFFRKKPKAEP